MLKATCYYQGAGKGLFYTSIIRPDYPNSTGQYTVVYNTGTLSNQASIEWAIKKFVTDLNADVDLLVVSHFDKDHINKITYLAKELKRNRNHIKHLILPYTPGLSWIVLQTIQMVLTNGNPGLKVTVALPSETSEPNLYEDNQRPDAQIAFANSPILLPIQNPSGSASWQFNFYLPNPKTFKITSKAKSNQPTAHDIENRIRRHLVTYARNLWKKTSITSKQQTVPSTSLEYLNYLGDRLSKDFDHVWPSIALIYKFSIIASYNHGAKVKNPRKNLQAHNVNSGSLIMAHGNAQTYTDWSLITGDANFNKPNYLHDLNIWLTGTQASINHCLVPHHGAASAWSTIGHPTTSGVSTLAKLPKLKHCQHFYVSAGPADRLHPSPKVIEDILKQIPTSTAKMSSEIVGSPNPALWYQHGPKYPEYYLDNGKVNSKTTGYGWIEYSQN